MRWLDSITDSVDTNLHKLQRRWRTEEPSMLQSMGSRRVGHDLVTQQQHPYLWGRSYSLGIFLKIKYINGYKALSTVSKR